MDCCSKSNSVKKPRKIEGKLCYCFNYTENQFLLAIRDYNENKLINEIKRKMKSHGCFCEKSNPSGKCCLKDITKFVKIQRGS